MNTIFWKYETMRLGLSNGPSGVGWLLGLLPEEENGSSFRNNRDVLKY
jgi:hypothetical protein